MKIFKSIKWRLQIWYGLILVAVLAGLGISAYQLERGRVLRRIDDEVHHRFSILSSGFRRPPRGPDMGAPPPGQLPPDVGPDDEPLGQIQRPPLRFHLPPQVAGLFDTNTPNHFFFFIRSHNGDEIASGGVVPSRYADQIRNSARVNQPREPMGMRPPPIRTANGFRELFQVLPSGNEILVGCSISPELAELHRTALKLLAVGAIILFLGLAGGGWIVSGAIRPVQDISATAVKISAGDLSQRINVADAETELGQLANVLNSTFARLEAAFAQQQQFTTDAAHELRTPVSVMLTQTQTALNRYRSPDEYRETIEACLRATQRMRRLIESLMELARLDAGQEQMMRLPFDLSRTVSDCVELVRPLADEHGVNVQSNLPPLKCVGDSERLAQVITNLLTNAIQYNKENGEVRISAQTQNGMVVLAVSDTGRGISTEDRSHVFERFYRADKSRSSTHTGLGLAISKAIVEAHGGTIEVASEENAGTTFTMRLPMN